MKKIRNAPKVRGLKLRGGAESFKASWNKLSAAQLKKVSKVEIQYSTAKSFKTYRRAYASKTKTNKKVKGLKKGTTYYVRVRNIMKKSGSLYT